MEPAKKAKDWPTAGHWLDMMWLSGRVNLEKAQAAVEEIKTLMPSGVEIKAALNETAAQSQEIIVLTVPYAVHQTMLEAIKPFVEGKVFIDVTVPLVPPKVTRVQIPIAGSAAMEAVNILGENVKIVSAFQNISYERLLNNQEIDCDVLVTGTDKETREIVIGLVQDAGMKGWDAGPIENSIVAEGLTSILIHLNKKYGVEASGIRITGIPQ